MSLFWMVWIILLLSIGGNQVLWADPSVDVALREGHPTGAIYDPNLIISLHDRRVLTQQIRSIQKSAQIDIIVVVLNEAKPWQPAALAEQFGKRWAYQRGNAVILWLNDEPDNPTITIGGGIKEEISNGDLDKITFRARAKALSEEDTGLAIREAVSSLGKDLRSAGQKVASRQKSNQFLNDLFSIMSHYFSRIILGIGALCLCLWIGIHGLLKLWKWVMLSLIPKRFPKVVWKRRFGAPHCGIAYTFRPKPPSVRHERKTIATPGKSPSSQNMSIGESV